MSGTVVHNYDGGGKREWEVPARGPYRACVGAVWDVGIHDTGAHGFKPKVCLAYELDKRGADGKRFIVFGSYTKSAHPAAALRPIIDATLGQNLSESLQKALDLTLMVGKTVRVNVEHTSTGKAKVKGVWERTADMPEMELEGDFSKPFGIGKWLIERQQGGAPGEGEPVPEGLATLSQQGAAVIPVEYQDDESEIPF